MRRLLADVLEDQLSINSALPRTLGALLIHPGRLTVEYSRGRIASYIAPFRLYLVSSLLFFLTLSVVSRASNFEVNSSGGTPADESADAAATVSDAVTEALGAIPPVADSVISEALGTVASVADSVTGASRDSGAEERRPFGIHLTTDDFEGDSIDWSRVVNTGIPLLDSVVVSRARRLGDLPPEEALRALVGGVLQNAPTAMFLLLPVFALLLKIFYLRSRRFYVEHFVFALHYHAFAFLLFTLVVVLPDAVRPEWLLIWLLLYLPISLKKVYRQGFFTTMFKWTVLSFAYSFLLAFAVFGTAIATFLLL